MCRGNYVLFEITWGSRVVLLAGFAAAFSNALMVALSWTLLNASRAVVWPCVCTVSLLTFVGNISQEFLSSLVATS